MDLSPFNGAPFYAQWDVAPICSWRALHLCVRRTSGNSRQRRGAGLLDASRRDRERHPREDCLTPRRKGRQVSPGLRRPPRRERPLFPDSLQIPANLARGHAYDTCIHIASKWKKTTHTILPLRRKSANSTALAPRAPNGGPPRALAQACENYVTDATQPEERATRQILMTIPRSASPSTPTQSSRFERRNSQECELCRQK
jgi:hypothetical protein